MRRHPDPPRLLEIAVTCFVLGLLCLALIFLSGCSLNKEKHAGALCATAVDRASALSSYTVKSSGVI